MTYVEEWQALLPAQHIVLATDAFTHSIVWMRDIGQWLGARECTSACIGKTLDGGTSILLVPGGQAEIFNAQSWGTTVAVHKSHKGFIKLALRHRARLVPVFSFGEWEMMDNISLPWLQRHSRKLLGFPFPFLPYGRFWLPLPRRPPHGITIVVGRPVSSSRGRGVHFHPGEPSDSMLADGLRF
ncbi:diacylglycerol acyltransferase [Pelagophyceae sp. CCMP2097]|nr:diacylglycerol acyltransferase [Pelagophyceae sp. CCMP2097]